MLLAGAAKLVRVTSDPQFGQALSGYFTYWASIAGRTPAEINRTLGLRRSDLSKGCYVYRLLRVPEPDEFEVRGYTTLPNGLPLSEGQREDAAGYRPGLGVVQFTLVKPVPAALVCFLKEMQPLTLALFTTGRA